MGKYRLSLVFLLIFGLWIAAPDSTAEAKSKKAATITITKANNSTAKKVHTSLNKGKAVNLKVKGNKKASKKLFAKLNTAVGNYNKYGVVFQCNKRKKEGKYYTYQVSAYNAKLYKYGLLLVQDIVKEQREEYKRRVKKYEDQYREQYFTESSSDYREVASECWKLPYDAYERSLTSKTHEFPCGHVDELPITSGSSIYSEGKTYERTYNYATYTDEDGKVYYLDIDDDDVIWCLHMRNSEDYYLFLAGGYTYSDKDLSIGEWKQFTAIKLSDVTFYNEPIPVDKTKLQQTLEGLYKTSVEKELKGDYFAKELGSVLSDDFCNLSQALRVYYVSRAFHPGASKWCSYVPKSVSGNGLDGVRDMLKRQWSGKCSNYAKMECTMYKILGLSDSDYYYIDCKSCNHAWTTVKIKNSKGQTAWAINNYGIGAHYDDLYASCVNSCMKHGYQQYIPQTNKKLDSFEFIFKNNHKILK